MGDLNCLFKPIANGMDPFRGCGSLYVSEEKHGSAVHIVHLGRSSVDSLIQLPGRHEFFSSLWISVVNEWGVSNQLISRRPSLRVPQGNCPPRFPGNLPPPPPGLPPPGNPPPPPPGLPPPGGQKTGCPGGGNPTGGRRLKVRRTHG